MIKQLASAILYPPSLSSSLPARSWNRTPPLGYRVVNVALAPDGRAATSHTVFAEGWVDSNGTHWGRPTGLLRMPDGSLLVGDDYGYAVYRCIIAWSDAVLVWMRAG